MDNREENSEEVEFQAAVPDRRNDFFGRLLGSCYNPDVMLRTLSENFWRTVWFLARVLLLVAVVQVGVTGCYTWSVVGETQRNLKRELPVVHFRNGDLRVEAETPYEFKIYRDYRFIIDPSGEVTRARLDRKVLGVAVDGAIFVRSGPDSFQSLSTRLYAPDESGPEATIDSDFLNEWLPYFRFVLILTLVVVALLELGLGTAIRVVLISFGGLLARQSEEAMVNLSWGQILRISCYTVVPVVILQTLFRLLGLAGYRLPFQEFLLLLTGTAWTFVAVKRIQSGLKKQLFDQN